LISFSTSDISTTSNAYTKWPLLFRYCVWRCWNRLLMFWIARMNLRSSLINPSPRHSACMFWATSVAVFSKQMHLGDRLSTIIIHASEFARANVWLFPDLMSVLKDCWWQTFRYRTQMCSEQWPKR
jgi:hypothetical protein